jgi:hypothetical protein
MLAPILLKTAISSSRGKTRRNMRVSAIFAWTATASLLLLAGCTSCDPTPVPFQSHAGETDTPATPAAPAATFQPSEGTNLPDGTADFAIEGARVTLPGQQLRAALPVDFDADGDRDALVVAVDANGVAKLFATTRVDAAFQNTSELGTLFTPSEGCSVQRFVLRHFAPHIVVATYEGSCADPTRPFAPEYSLVGVSASPNVRERFGVAPASGLSRKAVMLAFRAQDKDGDGNEDLLVDVRASGNERESSPVLTLTYFDRPSGLARDAHEPEATLLSWMAETRTRANRRNTQFVASMSERVLDFHAAICRESGEARVRVGDALGVSCGNSAAASNAFVQVIKERARTRELDTVLALWDRMSGHGYALSDAQRTEVTNALRGVTPDEQVRLIEGPRRNVASSDIPRVSTLGFLPSGTEMILRGSAPQVFDTATNATRDGDDSMVDTHVSDPSHALVVASVHRTCQGFEMIIARGDAYGGVGTSALLVAETPPAGTPCPLPAALARDTGGFVVLGWAPQGVVTRRGSELYVTPLDSGGAVAAPTFILGNGMPAPAPVASGAMASNGRAFVQATPLGVLVSILSPERRTVLLRPAEWETLGASAHDLAISDDLSRVAFMAGDRTFVLLRGEAPAAP